MVSLSAKDISVVIDGKEIVRDATLSVTGGELVVVIGPNGAGKSTLVKAMAGSIEPNAGEILLDDRKLSDLSTTERARKLSYLPQARSLAWPLFVEDMVALGRHPWGATSHRLGNRDVEAVAQAIKVVDIDHLRKRRTDTLSGGEMARAHLARCLTTEAPLLLADEPLTALDPLHQWQCMAIFKDFVDQGGGALIVMHDLTLAARFASRLVWMADGNIVADGPPSDTMTEARLADVYGVHARVDEGGVTVLGAI